MSGFQALKAKPEAKKTTSHEGGTVYIVDEITQLRRFMILGAGATYYQTAEQQIEAARELINHLIENRPADVLGQILEIHAEGSALRKDVMIFALALLCDSKVPYEIRREAYGAVSIVCNTGTDFLHWLAFRKTGRASSRLFRTVVANWFRRHKNPALQVIKYEQRDGWSMNDALRLAQPVAKTDAESFLFSWIKHPDTRSDLIDHFDESGVNVPTLMRGWRDIRKNDISVTEAADLVRQYNLPREAIPGPLLAEPAIWAALIPGMPGRAMLRNLGKITSLNLLRDPEVLEEVVAKVRSAAGICHPFEFLIARTVYVEGHGRKGKLTWTPQPAVIHALTEGFRESYGTLKVNMDVRLLIAIDTSASMGADAGDTGITCDQAAAALASVLRWQFPTSDFVAYSNGLTPMNIKTGSMDEFSAEIQRLNHVGTDCRLPLLLAEQGGGYDGVISITDSETRSPSSWSTSYEARWSLETCATIVQRIHKTKKLFRHAVVAMAANYISVADPHDAQQMDFEGLDASLPKALALFIEGVV